MIEDIEITLRSVVYHFLISFRSDSGQIRPTSKSCSIIFNQLLSDTFIFDQIRVLLYFCSLINAKFIKQY